MANGVLTVEEHKAQLKNNINFKAYSNERLQELAEERFNKAQQEAESAVDLAAAEQEVNQGGDIEENIIPPGHDIDPNRTMRILKTEAEEMGIEYDPSTAVGGSSSFVTVKETDIINYVTPEAEEFVNEFKSTKFEESLNTKDIQKHAGYIAFNMDTLDNFDTKSDIPLTREQKSKYQADLKNYTNQQKVDNLKAWKELKGNRPTVSNQELAEAGICNPYLNVASCLKKKREADPNYKQLQRSIENRKYNTKAEYEEYEKTALGENYDRYMQWKADPTSVEFSEKELLDGKNKAFQEKLFLKFREMDDVFGGEKYNEQLQKAIYLALKPELDSQKEQDEALTATSEVLKKDAKIIENKFTALKKEEQAYVDVLEDYQTKLEKIDFKEEDYFNLSKVEYDKKLADINTLMKDYEEVYTDYEEKDFKGKYEILIKEQENFTALLNKFNTDIEKFAKPGTDKANMIARAAGMDYSLTARAGMAMEEFFIGGLTNFVSMTQGVGLKIIKGLTQNPEKKKEIDQSISAMEETLADYNRNLAAKRDVKIPPALTLADLGENGGSYLDYIGEALADNSPSILTTFIPAAAAIRGGILLSRSAGLGFAARRAALTAQKTYGLYAMRASQGIFFVGESGGKYGELLSTEYDMRDRVKDINKLLAEEGLTAEQRTALIEEKENLDNDLINNFSFGQKAFSSYAYGGVATYAETLGSLKLVQGVNATAKGLGKTIAKKHLYKNSTNFAGVIVKGTIKGLRPAVTKAMPSEIFEEAFTQVGHNAIDIIALNEDKSLLEGLNADFFVKTAITSFAIMGPTTMANTKNILTNEFKTRNEVLTNKKDVNELLVIQSRLDKLTGNELKEAKKRRKQLVKKLAFHDGMTLQKLNHMSEGEIREAAELARQKRVLSGRMKSLAQTGDTQSQDFKEAKAGIEAQYNALSEKQNDLLGAKGRSIQAKMADLNNKYGSTANLDLAYTLGLNDFAMDAAMTLSDKNKKFSVISEAAFGDPNAMEAELKAEGYTEAEIKEVLESFSGDAPANGMYTVNGDIIINEGAMNARMHGASGVADANYAAVAPLEELFHANIASKGLKIDGKLKGDAQAATIELLEMIDSKKETGAISEEDYKELKERIDMYKSKGEYNYEEMLAQINNAMAIGVLNESDFQSIPSLRSYINGAINSVLGDSSWMLKIESAADAAAFMKNYRTRTIEGQKVSAGGDEVKEDTQTQESVGGEIVLPIGESDRINAIPKIRKKAEESFDAIDQRINAAQITADITFEEFRTQQVKDNQVDRSIFDENRTQAEQAFNDYQSTLVVVEETAQESKGKPLTMEDQIDHVFSKNSGVEAIETILDDTIQHWEEGEIGQSIYDWYWDENATNYKIYNAFQARIKKIDELSNFDVEWLRTELKKAKGENKENLEFAIEEKFKRLGPEIIQSAEIDIYTGKDISPTPTQAQESKGKTILAPATEAYMEVDNDVLQQGLNSALKNNTDQVFPIAQAIVEKNWGLISPNLNINNQQEMEAAKEVVIDQLIGTFEGSGQGKYSARNTSALEGFSLDPGGDTPAAQVSTYLAKTIKTRKPEIDAAIAERTAGPGVDVTQMGDVEVETTEIEEAKVVKKPSETTGLDKVTETKIIEAVTESYKGKEVTLAETRNIPKKVASVYADMFGINPQTITDKKRNFQKKDAVGLTKAKQFLLKNAKDDFARLPKTVDALGRGTFIPKNVRDALYTDGKLTGTLKNYLDLIRIKPTKPIYRDRTAQTIRGLLGLHIRNRILETSTTKPKRIQSGAVFSKGKKLTPKEVENYNKLLKAKSKSGARKIAGIGNVVITEENRSDIINKLETLAEDENIAINPLILAPMAVGGAIRTQLNKDNREGKKLREWLKENDPKALKKDKNGNYIQGGSYWYKTTDGNYIKGIESKTTPGVFSQPKVNNLIPNRNKVFFGVNDPNYETIYKKAEKTYEKTHGKKPPIPKRVIPNPKNPDNVFSKDSQERGEANVAIMEDIIEDLESGVSKGLISIELAAQVIENGYQATKGFIKLAAPFVYRSDKFEYGTKDGFNSGVKYREEHNPPASTIGAMLMYAVKTGTFGNIKSLVKNNYTQTLLSKKDDQIVTEKGFAAIMPDKTTMFGFAAADLLEGRYDGVRYAAADIDLNSIKNMVKKGKPTMAEELVIPIKNKKDINLESIHYQNELIVESKGKPIALDRKKLKVSLPAQNAKAVQAKTNAKNFNVILNDNQRSFEQKENMLNSMESKGKALKLDKPKKGISVFDFDDTLAKTKEQVLVSMPDNTLRRLSPAQFAQQAGELMEQGAEFDFSQFEDVKGAEKGPLADLIRKRQNKFGSGDIYVLTARPNSAGPAIKQFLDSIGINIPLENITGLEDGSPQAKADWVLNKAAEGYNDFYFADDSLMNVKAVDQILNAVDVKSKTQQAMLSKGKKLDQEFNKIVEETTGLKAEAKYSPVRARLEGRKKDKGFFKWLGKQLTITPSAEDFMGLMYDLMGSGKQGNRHAKWIRDNLINPFNKAEQQILSAKVAVANDFAALKKQFPSLKTKGLNNPLMNKIGVGPYTKSQAMRVYIWTKQGMEIPGLSKRDQNALVKAVEADSELNVFADEVILIQKDKQYPTPTDNWAGGTIDSDLMSSIDKTFRRQVMTEFDENTKIIFSEKNLNKLEAIFGKKWVDALKDSLRRMKSGSNRPVYQGGGARIVNEMLDWLNGSVGAVMFLNVKSGLLQLISNVNFINWGDNNIYQAAKAFASKEYWPTVVKLMNSDYLVNRRDGLKINVNEAELANAAKDGGMKGAIAYLLDKGFIITRIMDSLAIATGGATFYINRRNALLERQNPDTGKKYTQAEAEAKAFDDFYAISEESQQSSNPSKISQQQASLAGRVLLAFQNVTMQYNRMTKKSIRDLYNRRKSPGQTQRESDLGNLSKIIYYVTIQNLIFNALQQALFAVAFDDEPDEKEKNRAANIANGMADSLLFGLGFGGAAISTVKNILRVVMQESDKKSPDYEEAVWEVFNVSPVLDSKIRKLRTTAKTFSWNMEEIKKRGWSLDNPTYLAVSQLISAATNIPLDRVLRKIMNMRMAMDEETRTWQRVALMLGWTSWSVGLPYWGLQSTIKREEKAVEKAKKDYKNDIRKLKAQGYKKVMYRNLKDFDPKDIIEMQSPAGTVVYYVKVRKGKQTKN